MKRMPFALQLSSQRAIVLDDAVMHYGQYTGTVRMGVGIDVVGSAMGSPACVTDAQRARSGPRAVLDISNEIGEFAGTPAQFKFAGRGEHCYPGRIIATVFKFTEAIKQYGSNIGTLRADVTYDTAHGSGILSVLRYCSGEEANQSGGRKQTGAIDCVPG